MNGGYGRKVICVAGIAGELSRTYASRLLQDLSLKPFEHLLHLSLARSINDILQMAHVGQTDLPSLAQIKMPHKFIPFPAMQPFINNAGHDLLKRLIDSWHIRLRYAAASIILARMPGWRRIVPREHFSVISCMRGAHFSIAAS